jgi:Dolichyl-phosphate-mannose-protein mannosyltransferase
LVERAEGLSRFLRAPDAGDHVNRFAQILLHEQTGSVCRIAAIAIHHKDEIGVDRGKGGGNGSRFAASSFGDHLCPGGAGGEGGSVIGTVIDHQNARARKNRGILAHDISDPEGFVQARDENGERRQAEIAQQHSPLGTMFHAVHRRFAAVECLLLLRGSPIQLLSMLLLSDPVSTATVEPPVPAARPTGRRRRATFLVLALLLFAGCFLRLPPGLFEPGHSSLHWLSPLHPKPKFQEVGFDEKLYRAYVNVLTQAGLESYPALAEHYVETQRILPSAILPPTRFFYIAAAYGWNRVWGTDPISSLRAVSSLCGVLLLALAALFAWRLGGQGVALCVTALMAFAPTQIHMSQHALIDGVFAFWATLSLWLLWENLQRPHRLPWLISYSFSLAVMVLTKENAMFAYIGLLVLLAANYWLRFGRITPALCLATLLGPLLGVVTLVFLCGGLGTTVEIYRLLVAKASVLNYAIVTGDGPWYRYLVDLMVVNPVILILAIGGTFQLRRSDRPGRYLLLFVVGSFVVMANIRYGMNLRYANMWDFPLRYLAVFCLWQIIPRKSARAVWLSLCIMALCSLELRQYEIFFVRNDLYELVPQDLLRAVKILK